MTRPIRTKCRLIIVKPYFTSSWRNPKLKGKATMEVEVVRHSYGAKHGQHTFTVLVLKVIEACDGCHQVGEKFLIKGRNLYPNVIDHECKVENFNCVNG